MNVYREISTRESEMQTDVGSMLNKQSDDGFDVGL